MSDFLSYNIPVLTSDLSYFKEIAKDYGCIELFKRDDQKDLENKLIELLHNERKREILTQKSKEFVRKSNWTEFARFTNVTYKQILVDNK